jgi:hypothetical protein
MPACECYLVCRLVYRCMYIEDEAFVSGMARGHGNGLVVRREFVTYLMDWPIIQDCPTVTPR